jgi:hypothetical protein
MLRCSGMYSYVITHSLLNLLHLSIIYGNSVYHCMAQEFCTAVMRNGGKCPRGSST